MNNAITSYELENATGRIDGGSRGTCFLISSELVLTAAHVVKENKKNDTPITIKFLNSQETPLERTGVLQDYDLDQFDIAILKLDQPIKLKRYVPLLDCDIPNGETFLIYGYPNEAYTAGKKIENNVSRTNPHNTKWDIDLDLEESFNLGGLSGAALITNGHATGLVITQLDKSLHAISIKRVKEFLEKNGISFSKKILNDDIPNSLKEEVAEVIDSSNTPVIDRLDKALLNNNGGYMLLSGSPGSGKTTLVANYSGEEEKKIEIAGKYFLKIPNDSQTLAVRASRDRLLSWIESVCCRILFNKPPEKNQKKFDEWLAFVNELLIRLGEHYKSEEQLGVLIIDGLNDANKILEGNLSDLLSILPENLPNNICFLFSCTSKEILPDLFRSQITTAREITVTPLEIENVENFIRKTLDEIDLSLDSIQISALGGKSEGHPLYLRYLVNYLINHQEEIVEDQEVLVKWINEIPAIGGDIEIYYNSVWSTIADEPEASRIVATISRLRQAAPAEAIIKMLPDDSRELWDGTFLKVKHLLAQIDPSKLITIYHSSFAEFITNSTNASSTIIHSRIGEYCVAHQDNSYGVTNVIYHLYNGIDIDKENAVTNCNQNWVNKCAIDSVSPDYILTDIKEILKLSFSLKNSIAVIRILLLLQRMRFRYDRIFRENSFELVETLIEMGRIDDAMRYLIRDETLLVGIKDGIYFFHKVLGKGEYKSAKKIFKVLEKENKRNIQDKELSMEMIFDFMQIISLEFFFNSEKSMDKFTHFKNFTSNELKKWGNDDETIKYFKDIIGSFHYAFIVWTSEKAVLPSMIEEMGFQVDKYCAGFTAMLFIEIKNIKRSCNSMREIPFHKKYIEEIENIIDKFSYHDKDGQYLAQALISESKRVDIVEKIIKEMKLSSPGFSIRDKNGVNCNMNTIIKEISVQTYLGYVDDKTSLSRIPDDLAFHNWENFITSFISNIGFLIGRGYRFIAEGNLEDIKRITSELKDNLSKLRITLMDRILWGNRRAYALPEEVLPMLYRQISLFFVQFSPDDVSEFIDDILEHSNEQVGLYTEGYRKSIFEISYVLSQSTLKYKNEVFALLNKLETHIDKSVQNRWERAPELMKLAELYARIGAEEKAEEVFKMMLNSSMGISWYKEAQLELITSTVESLHDNNSDITNLKTFAGHLDFASGEMTFQRYVRMEKERFVGSLNKTGHLSKAINYFKQITLSSLNGVQERAESSVIDTPFKGEGYELGAREIEEEHAILQLLKSLGSEVNIHFRWVLAELFVNDDFPYIQDFAELLGEIISKMEESSSPQINFLLKRLVEITKTRIEEPFQEEFIHLLYKHLPLKNSNDLQALFIKDVVKKEEVIESNNEIVKTETEVEPVVVETNLEEEDVLKTFVLKAKEELELGNKRKARGLLAEGWAEETKGKYSVLDANSKESFEVLLLASDSDEDILEACEDIVLNEPYNQDWVLASKLINLLGGKIDRAKRKELTDTVLNHLDLMLRTTEQNNEIFDRYEWMGEDSIEENVDIQIAKFIIWLLNYPNFNSNRTIIELILWLCSVEPELIIPPLVGEAFSKESNISSELAMHILYELVSKDDHQVVWSYLKDREDEILTIDHFMKKYVLLKTVEAISSNISEAKIIFQKLEATFPINSIDGNDVDPPWYWLELIKEPFYLLEQDDFFNGKVCKEIEKNVSILCERYNISEKELSRINTYYSRSFHGQKDFISPAAYIPRYALNKALCDKISITDAQVVAEHLKLKNSFVN